MVNAKAHRKRVAIDGVLLLDKPVGFSSNDALIKTKRLLNALKAGHTGTLDPFATGLLPLCFGEATKFSQDLLDADKTYDTVVHLGICTTTGDTEGDVTTVQPVALQLEKIAEVLKKFEGVIAQVPPMYSALKRDGKPLYEYARAGITLEREAREVTIHSIELIEWRSPYLSLRVKCSKGTYIRVLGEDIGKALGCGAHLNALRRIQVGHLSMEDVCTLEQIEGMQESERQAMLAPTDALLSTFPAITLDDELARRFLHGQRLPLHQETFALPPPGRVRIYRGADAKLLGTGRLAPFGVLAPERLIATVSS